jgi:DNA-binding LytR/AlgR family response regulator
MAISALIVDDEAAARSRLRKLLSTHPFDLVEGDACDGLEALQIIQAQRPQVVFLDIEMPGLGGFELVEALAPETMPLVVFVTAYDEHALAAFEANAVAYLLKPVNEDRLGNVVRRLQQLVGSPGVAAAEATRSSAIAGAAPKPLHHVLAVQREGYRLIPLDEVCFFQVKDGVTYVTTMTATYRTNYAIGDLETRLPAPAFFRAHRATIVNIDKVATISPMFKGALVLTMKDSNASEVQVSERHAKRVRELLQL